MLFRNIHADSSWPNKTMSILIADRQKSIRDRLLALPSRNLFDSDCTDANAEDLFSLSWYAEDPSDRHRGAAARLHTLESLKARVLKSLEAEMALLSVEEHDLLVRTVIFGGRHFLTDPETLRPAFSLVRRLWCSVSHSGETLQLTIAPALRTTILLILAGETHRQVRDLIQQVHDRIDTSLYLLGVLSVSAPEHHLRQLLNGTHADNQPDLIYRFFHSGYDLSYNRAGQAFLVHPGLADPGRYLSMMISSVTDPSGFFSLDEQALTAASDTLADLEDPLYEHLLFLLLDVTRPENDAEDVIEDLFILAKQSVSPEEMEEVLSASLICLPTEEMRSALRDLSARIPRWFFLSSGMVQ